MGWRSKKKERKNAKKEYRLIEESNLKTREPNKDWRLFLIFIGSQDTPI